jgi:hypothetical protein
VAQFGIKQVALLVSEAFEDAGEREVDVVIVAARFDGAIRERGRFVQSTEQEKSLSEYRVRAFAVLFQFERLVCEPDDVFVFLVRVVQKGDGGKGFRELRLQRQCALCGGHAPVEPFFIPVVITMNPSACLSQGRVREGKMRFQSRRPIEHLYR